MLDETIKNYLAKEIYPFHMPGHKRQIRLGEEPYQMDMTEIPGMDNLAEPEAALGEVMHRLEKLYHSKKSFLLVNGSTCGILAAVFSVTNPGDEIIIGRNCHKSVYHAAEIRQLKVHYLTPKISDIGIVLGTSVEEYKNVIEAHPKAKAVLVTSPTYEGRVEPIEDIVRLAHSKGMFVIVDAAHGAHLEFGEDFPSSPLKQEADMVVMSLHKTLPSMTQTAVLHINLQTDIPIQKVQRGVNIFQTSSPSYILMSSVCQCVRFLEEKKDAFLVYQERLRSFYRDCSGLKHLHVSWAKGADPGKVVIETAKTDKSGYWVQEVLRREYQIELEMSSFYYALAMSSVMDTKEGFHRLKEALFAIDSQCGKRKETCETMDRMYLPGEKAMELYEAAQQPQRVCELEEAVGKIAGEMISIYPPAIPIVVPGEIITSEQIKLIRRAMDTGLLINGLKQAENGRKEVTVIVN